MKNLDKVDGADAFFASRLMSALNEQGVIVTAEQANVVVRDFNAFLQGARGQTAIQVQLREELGALSGYIQATKNEIASLQPSDITANQIPLATDELDAVIKATEDAANKIMDVCDEVALLAEGLPTEIREKINSFNTRIFEACNFQDITGQRITKVVNALKHIEIKVGALLAVLGEEGNSAEALNGQPKPASARNPDEELLNGPQLPGQGIDQETVNNLLAD